MITFREFAILNCEVIRILFTSSLVCPDIVEEYELISFTLAIIYSSMFVFVFTGFTFCFNMILISLFSLGEFGISFITICEMLAASAAIIYQINKSEINIDKKLM